MLSKAVQWNLIERNPMDSVQIKKNTCQSNTLPEESVKCFTQEQAEIFGRFCRASGAYQQDGVGIGLYLTRQIAQHQGGYVKVESVLGKGSTFSLYLPREKPKKKSVGALKQG